MEKVSIEGKVRKEAGTKYARALRRENQVPCVVYGGKENLHFSAHKNAFRSLIYTPDFKLASIKLDSGVEVTCILKSLQFHPVTDEIEHVDLLELSEGKLFKAEVPVKITGSAPGVRSGGKLQQKMRTVKIKTTPEALVDVMEVSIDGLELGQSVRVKDLSPIDGVEVISAASNPVASIEIPRAMRSAASNAEGEEGTETETETKAEE